MTAQDSQEPKENNVSEPESSDHPAKSGWYDDPEGSGGLRWYDAKANKWSETASQATTISLEPDTTKDPEESRIQLQEDDKKQKAGSKTKNNEEASPIATLPAINNWKTSVGFSVLGCLSFLVFLVSTHICFNACDPVLHRWTNYGKRSRHVRRSCCRSVDLHS